MCCCNLQAVKSVKSKVRELVQQGYNPHQAAKMAAASITGEPRVAVLPFHITTVWMDMKRCLFSSSSQRSCCHIVLCVNGLSRPRCPS